MSEGELKPDDTQFHKNLPKVYNRQKKLEYFEDRFDPLVLDPKKKFAREMKKAEGDELLTAREAGERRLEKPEREDFIDKTASFVRKRVLGQPTEKEGIKALIGDVQKRICNDTELLQKEIDLALERAEIVQNIAREIMSLDGREQIEAGDYRKASATYDETVWAIVNGIDLQFFNVSEGSPTYFTLSGQALENVQSQTIQFAAERLRDLLPGAKKYLRGQFGHLPSVNLKAPTKTK